MTDRMGSSAGGGVVADLRIASGDVYLRPWRLTADRLRAYANAVCALAYGGSAVDAEDPGSVLDADRQPLLRPWEYMPGPPGPDDVGPAHAVAELLAHRSAIAASIRPHMTLEDFAAAQLKLLVCVRALLLLWGQGAGEVSTADVRTWTSRFPHETEADEDFAHSLVTFVNGRPTLDAAFAS